MTHEENFYGDVGQRIRQARRAAGVTQQSLADRISLSRASITNVEQGRQKLLLYTLFEIAHALRVSPMELMPPAGILPEEPLNDLLRQRSDVERAWIGSALNSFLPKGTP